MKFELREKGRRAGRSGGGRRHAVLRRMAGRGGDGAEQSNQIMSGVCGHWVRKFSGVSQTMSRFRGWMQAGAALLTNPHLPNFLKGQIYQGAGKTSACRGSTATPARRLREPAPSGRFRRWWARPSLAFPIILQAFSFCWAFCWGALSAASSVPSAGFRSCCTRSRLKKLSTKKLKPLTYLKYLFCW